MYPFVLFDYAVITGKGKPPFGCHPHAGMIACTVIVDKGNVRSEDHTGQVEQVQANGLGILQAGAAAAHNECSDDNGEHHICQIIVKMVNERMHDQPKGFFLKESDIPVLDVPGGTIRMLIGGNLCGGPPSPVDGQLSGMPPHTLLARVLVNPGKTVSLDIAKDADHGFAYVLKGSFLIGKDADNSIDRESGLAIFGGGDVLNLQNPGNNDAEVLIGAGKRVDEPWVKLLGNNGFVIAPNEGEAEIMMEDASKLLPKSTDATSQ